MTYEEFKTDMKISTWKRKKKKIISQSIAKVNYVVSVVNCSNIMWINKLLKGTKEEIIDPIVSIVIT